MSDSVDKPRALLIGLDGMTWSLLLPMLQAGWLPNLQQVLAQGAYGVLRSTVPPLTAPAWTSFLTGLGPGSHGVFSFQRRSEPGMERVFVNSTAVRAPRAWHWLAQHGLTMGCVNMPMTWPPQPMPAGGYLVTGMLTPSTDSPFTDPPELAEELRAMNYVCDLRIKLHERDVSSPAGQTALTHDLRQVLLRRETAVFKLLAERPVDVFCVVFETPDRLQHWMWGAVAEMLADDGSLVRTSLHDELEACYRELDRVVGRLLRETAGPDTHVFLASDHGFGPLQRRVHVDQWLAERGWLRYKPGPARLRRELRGPIQQVKGFIPRSLLRRGRKALAVPQLIDWQHTQAYSGRTMEHAVYVNLKGREPQGTVDSDHYDDLRREIAQALLGLQDPTTGAPLVTATYLREEIYQGPYVKEAPDLLFSLAPGHEPTSELSRQGLVSDASNEGAGMHQPEGILMITGPGVRGGARLPDRRIEDVLPTLLYVLGRPVSSVLQGHLIKAAFEPSHLASFPPTYTSEPAPSWEPGPDDPWQAFGPEETARVAERLAALGYLR